jgi:ATP-binding cassette, subfamily B, bacterial
MAKFKEAVSTLVQAARYSISFCWRNSKSITLIRLAVTAASTLFIYGLVQATGFVANSVQAAHADPSTGHEALNSSILIFAGILLAGVVIKRLEWLYRVRWNHTLNNANEREVQQHRARLDVGRVRSKQYDDLDKHIKELPHRDRTRVAFTQEIITFFASLISFTLFGATLFWHKPIYAVALLVLTAPMVIVEFRQGGWWWEKWHEMVPHHKRRAVLEMPYRNKTAFLQGLMFNQLPYLRFEIDSSMRFVYDEYEYIRKRAFRNEMYVHFLAAIGLVAVIAHAIWSTILSGGEIGTLLVVIAAARTFKDNLEGIAGQAAEQWNTAKGVILIERDFFGLKPVIVRDDPIVPSFGGAPHIRFDRVSFTYPDCENEVLHEVSFTIEPGSRVAIVGKSGNGKSTIQALLSMHYDPTSGAIYAGDINLRNIEPAEWSKYVSALTQEYVVLERTIEDEIASSRLEIPLDTSTVIESARFANFDEVIDSDPKGLKSQIGIEFGGREFSGGEKQRLALARVRYRNTPILILDEPDAKLDPESAQKVVDEVFALRGVTVIIITHHVSRAERCDKVIVMGKGKIVEQGSPAELMSRAGPYSALYRSDKKRLYGMEEVEVEAEQHVLT